MKQTSEYTYAFDSEQFYGAVKVHIAREGMTIEELCKLIGRHENWFRVLTFPSSPPPGMSVFLDVCNLLNLAPGSFFELVKVESTEIIEYDDVNRFLDYSGTE